ncbi:MAG: dihydroorotate dehydrogenase, partial [Actinomycetota bacterium]
MTVDTSVRVGPLRLGTPLIAASGTVGSVWEFARAAQTDRYGAMVAKSVSEDAWEGRPPPRLAPVGAGMLNGIGIQNPGIRAWNADTAPRLRRMDTQVWGSAVGSTPPEFARVASGLSEAGVAAVEINLSCPNLDGGRMFALDPESSLQAVAAVRQAVSLPLGAKLSPNAEDVVAVAQACREGGADWVTLTNTVWGAGIDIDSGRPLLSGEV